MNGAESHSKEQARDLKISTYADQAIEFLENKNAKAFKAVSSYFSLVIDKLKLFDITCNDDEITYDLVMERGGQMLSLRNEIINLIAAIAKFEEDSKYYGELHLFFENLLPYFSFRNEGESNNRLAPEPYVILGNELFIYAAAALLKHRRFEQLNEITNQGYFVSRRHHNFSREFIPFCKFNQNTETLTGRYGYGNVGENNSMTKYFKDRIFGEKFHYEELAQADFVLHLISLLDIRIDKERCTDIWYHQLRAASYSFEIFTRCESAWFFEKFAKCLRSVTKDELTEFFKGLRENQFGEIYYYLNFNWERAVSLKAIATRA